MTHRACPYCGELARWRFGVGDLNRRISKERFEYYECPSCTLLFLGNVPEDLGAYYTDDYHYIPASLEEAARCAVAERYKIELLQRFKRSGRLIEIGPAWGSFSYLAKKAGFDVTAIEMSSRCCAFLRDIIGVQVIESTNEAAALSGAGQADAIALWHVIEHLRAPWELIRIAAQTLAPGGVPVIAAPNPHALQFRLLRTRWVHIDAPRHVTLPSADFLTSVARAAGLRSVMATTRDRGSLGWNEFGWRFFAMTPFTNRVARGVAGLCGRMVSWLLAPFEAREGAGTAYTIVLEKPCK